jgi:hypothetical protein
MHRAFEDARSDETCSAGYKDSIIWGDDGGMLRLI